MIFFRDLRYGARALMQTPVFTIVAVTALALGIGANATVFSVGNYLVMKPLPARDPQSLTRIYTSRGANTTYPDFAAYRDGNHSFAAMAAFQLQPVSIRAGGEPEGVWATVVSGEYFSVLGIPAAAGRTIRPDEGQTAGSAPVAVISYGYWARRFASDPAAVGRQISINGIPFTIVGVMPRTFAGAQQPLAANLWIPLTMDPVLRPGSGPLTSRALGGLHIVGRLKDGVSVAEAQADLSVIAADLARAFPDTNRHRTVSVYRATVLPPFLRTPASAFVGFLLAVTALVLLIACTNVANLLLARSSARRREIAVRQALGAGRGRLVSQLLTEGLLLSSMGGAGGLCIAWFASRALMAVPVPAPMPIVMDFSLDYRVLLFTIAVSVTATLLFALAPALQTARADLLSSLKAGDAGPGYRRSRMRAAFITAQLALSVLLLLTAGLCVRALAHARSLDIGFDGSRVLTVSMDLETRGYTEPRGQDFHRRLLERLAGAPGIEAGNLVDIVPLTLSNSSMPVVDAAAPPRTGDGPSVDSVYLNSVSPGHFATLGIPLLQGRDFTPDDRAGAPRVAIINETMARSTFGTTAALGRRLRRLGSQNGTEMEVVGIARDASYVSVGEAPRRFVYMPLAQEYVTRATLLVRASGDPMTALPQVRRAMQELDPELALLTVQTMTEAISVSLLPARVAGLTLSVMGILALVLAAIGVYGTVSYVVRQRTREIGIRMSLGARPRDVLRLIMRQTVRWTAVGMFVGLALGAVVTRVLGSYLYGVSATDPVTFIATPLVLGLVALAASAGPATRAARIDPLITLKSE